MRNIPSGGKDSECSDAAAIQGLPNWVSPPHAKNTWENFYPEP
jgi:hypothetical protein